MAFLRRGLVTNKGAVPSVHTRNMQSVGMEVSDQVRHKAPTAQPVAFIRTVAKVLRMAQTQGEYHLVQLSCGHAVRSKSTFQGYCNKCQATH